MEKEATVANAVDAKKVWIEATLEEGIKIHEPDNLEDYFEQFIEMNFEKVKQSIIKEIFIAPKSEAEVENIVYFLSYYGYYDGIEGGYSS